MFTGIIKEMGEVLSLRGKPSGAELALKSELLSKEAAIGDSIAVSGACLTVTSIKGAALTFDLSDETLRATTLGGLKSGDKVNLEPALRATDQLGGHIVTGHVDAVGRIKEKEKVGDNFHFLIEAPPQVLDYLVEKGSVTIDGISLTVVDVLKGSFTIVIIPHTANVTTIGRKGISSPVNLEADIIGKYVAKFTRNAAGSGGGGIKKALFDAGYIKGAD